MTRHTLMLATVTLFALLIPLSAAQAQPGVVLVFEATVHSAPAYDADVVATLAEWTKVSVSETPENGWFKVRLADGTVGWIVAKHVGTGDDLEAEIEVDTVMDKPKPREKPRAMVYVRSLSHLATLVKSEPAIHTEALSLVSRDGTADVLTWGGYIVGGGMMLLTFVDEDCSDASFGICQPNINWTIGGGVVMLVGLIAGMAVRPGRKDLLSVVNRWNVKRPNEPFEFSD